MIPLPLPMIWGTYMKLVTKYQISAINSCWEKCAYMFNVDKNQLSRQTGSKNLMVPKNASHHMAYLYEACDQISDFCHQYLLRKMWRKIVWKDGRTEVKQYTPSPFGGIIRSKIGSKCVDLILIILAKCWNNFFSSKFCIWLYCENGKYMNTMKMSSRNIFFSPIQPNCFLQDSESK